MQDRKTRIVRKEQRKLGRLVGAVLLALLAAGRMSPSLSAEEMTEAVTEETPQDETPAGSGKNEAIPCIATVESYANVRKGPSEEAEVIGKIYRGGIGAVLESDPESGWILIRSGLVRGYVSAGCLAVGDEAEERIREGGTLTAQVLFAEINIYDEPDESANILTVAPESTFLEVLEETEAWTKVMTPYQISGWVMSDQIRKSVTYSTAETLEEEAQRLAQQETANSSAEEESALWKIAEEALQGTAPSKIAVMDAQVAQENAKKIFLEAGGTKEQAAAIEEEILNAPETEALTEGEESTFEALTEEETEREISENEAAYRRAVENTKQAQDAANAEDQEAQKKVDAAQDATITAQAAEKVAIEAARRAPRGAAGCDFATQRDHTMYFPPSLGEELVNYACQFVGNPYVWGGESLTNGCDCSGFTMLVYAKYGISLPHFAESQAAYGRAVSEDELEPGDLVFFERGGYIYHVAIYIGNGTIVHATNARNGICFTSLNYGTSRRLYRRLL